MKPLITGTVEPLSIDNKRETVFGLADITTGWSDPFYMKDLPIEGHYIEVTRVKLYLTTGRKWSHAAFAQLFSIASPFVLRTAFIEPGDMLMTQCCRTINTLFKRVYLQHESNIVTENLNEFTADECYQQWVVHLTGRKAESGRPLKISDAVGGKEAHRLEMIRIRSNLPMEVFARKLGMVRTTYMARLENNNVTDLLILAKSRIVHIERDTNFERWNPKRMEEVSIEELNSLVEEVHTLYQK